MSRHTCLAQERLSLTFSLPNVVKGKFRPDFQITFSNILKNKKYHVKVQAGSFHLNGRIVGFRPQTQKLQSPFKTPSSTLAVKRYVVAFEHPASIFGDPETVSPAGRNGAPKWFITGFENWLSLRLFSRRDRLSLGLRGCLHPNTADEYFSPWLCGCAYVHVVPVHSFKIRTPALT